MEEIIQLVLGAVLMLQNDHPKEVDKDRRNTDAAKNQLVRIFKRHGKDVRITVIEDPEAAIVQIRVSPEAWDA